MNTTQLHFLGMRIPTNMQDLREMAELAKEAHMYRRMIGFGQGEIQPDYDVLRAVYNGTFEPLMINTAAHIAPQLARIGDNARSLRLNFGNVTGNNATEMVSASSNIAATVAKASLKNITFRECGRDTYNKRMTMFMWWALAALAIAIIRRMPRDVWIYLSVVYGMLYVATPLCD